MTEGLMLLVMAALTALFIWGVLRADAHDEKVLERQLARIVGTPEWFRAQREEARRERP